MDSLQKYHEMEDDKMRNRDLNETSDTGNTTPAPPAEVDDDKESQGAAVTFHNNNLTESEEKELREAIQSSDTVPLIARATHEDLTATEAMSEMEKWGRVECPFPPPVPDNSHNQKVWDEYNAKKKEYDTAQREIMIAKMKKSNRKACMLDVKMDIEKHGFKMEKRKKPTDPFVFYKLITIHDGPDRNWEEHGYFLRLVLLLPSGTIFLTVLDIEDRFPVVKKSEAEKKDREAKLPCIFHGIVKNSKEFDDVLEMVLMRDEMYDFYPAMEEPHQNFWVDFVVNQNKTKPAIN